MENYAQEIREERGGRQLLFDEYIYKRNKSKGGKDYYTCQERNCMVKLQTPMGDLRVLSNNGDHDHPPVRNDIAKVSVIDVCKRRLDQNPTETIPKLFEDVCGEFEENYNGECPDFTEVKSQLYRYRAESLPPIPDDVGTIDFDEIDVIWRKTKTGGRFMRKHDVDYGITIFASTEQLQLLSECRFLMADGTFKTCPNPYSQIYTFHGLFGNRRIPLLWAYMTNRTAAHYIRLLELMVRYVGRESDGDFNPDVIVTDYELGFIAALPTVLPNTQHCGCLFHFDKAIFKKVQEYGLVELYKNDDRVQAYIRKIMSLPFLPILLLRNSYSLHKQRYRRLIRLFPQLNRLNSYVDQTWLDGPFPIQMWNCFNRQVRLRTTNTCEGWHARWNRRVNKVHPNIWVSIMALQKEEVVVKRVIQKYRRNAREPIQGKKTRRINSQIIRLKSEYTRDERTLDEYWSAITFYCHHFL